MKRVQQLVVGSQDSRPRGDCFRAALASVLERDPNEVPHFVDLDHEIGYYYLDLANAWLRKQGYPFEMLQRNYAQGDGWPIRYYVRRKRQQWSRCGFGLPGYWLMTVDSKLFPGSTHAVVARDDRVVWDPSPRAGEDAYDRTPYVFRGWATTFHVPNPAMVPRAS